MREAPQGKTAARKGGKEREIMTKTLSRHAAAAAAARKELAGKFPGVKFGVRSSSGTMSDAITISWTDGPALKKVEEIAKRYQYGHFDGMTDYYESNNVIDGLPQVEYVFTERKYSDSATAAARAEFDAEGWHCKDQIRHLTIDMYDEVWRVFNEHPDTIIRGRLMKRDLSAQGIVAGNSKQDVKI